jgi:DNA-binding phage protein
MQCPECGKMVGWYEASRDRCTKLCLHDGKDGKKCHGSGMRTSEAMSRNNAGVTKTNFSLRLQKVLRSKGITGHRLALWSKIPKQTIYRYLSGERQPTLTHASRIASALGADLAEFV